MAYTTINKSTDHFNTKLYTGNNSVRTETGVGFQPDWVWIKDRTQAGHNHNLLDAVRAAPKIIMSDSSAAQITDSTDGLTAFTSDGFSLGANTTGTQSQELNKNGNTYAAWCWKAGGGQGSANNDGSINTTYTSANTTAGFSISQYTANGTSGATVGHGLGVVPKMIIVKALNTTDNWEVYHGSLGAEKYLELNRQDAVADSTAIWNDTEPTSSVFSIGDNSGVNTNGNPYIAYCFAEKTGYSKFGSYTGNGNSTEGAFVYTGFKPAWVLIKKSSASGNDWYIWDNKRDIDNPGFQTIYANESDAEFYSSYGDFLSNGFKLRSASAGINGSGTTYIYMAFAEAPLVGTNNVPCTAR